MLALLDRARGAVLRASGPVCRPFVRSRELRVVALVGLSAAFSLGASVFATGYLLLWGPLTFGVTHLAFEARYLLPERLRKNGALLAILVAQAVSAFAGFAIDTLPLATAAALALARAPACVTPTCPAARRARGEALLLALAATTATGIVLAAPTLSRFALLHVHNLVPLAVWLGWRRRPTWVSAIVLAIVAAALGAVLVGAFDRVALHTPASDRVFSLNKLADAVAGGFAGAPRKRLLVAFAFTQSLHYALWIRVVAEEARARSTPRPWVASWRHYKIEAGAGFARASVVGVLLVPLAVVALGAVRARSFYVAASEFHASVEAVLVAVLFAGSRSPRASKHRYWHMPAAHTPLTH